MYQRTEKNTHDRGRSTLRERARKHFLQEKKDMEHEFQQNKALLNKWINDGFNFENVAREENKYIVHFVNPKTSDERDCLFNFESNYAQLENIWQSNDEK